MNNGGFGFYFGSNDDDRDDEKHDHGQGPRPPFGAFGFSAQGGLGDILNQFGQMISRLGSSVNSPDNSGPVNYDLAGRIARQQIASAPSTTVGARDPDAAQESVRLAELWLDDATVLPASGATVTAWDAEDWLVGTLPAWKRLVNPVAEHINEAQLASLPEEARQMIGPMLAMLRQMSGMNFGMQLGHALGELAAQALTGSDFGIPVAPAGTTALCSANIRRAGHDLDISSQEIMVYIAAREAARQRLFAHVPWLVERLVASVEEYANGLVIDTSHIEEAIRGLNLESGDPQSIQEAMSGLQGMDLSPTIRSRNEAAANRLETLLALVEGWTEHVVTLAMSDRIPTTAAMNEAWRRRRATGGSAEQAFSRVVGIEFAAPKVTEATELWRRADTAVGMRRRDAVWDHPDFLPTGEDLDQSAEFIDGLIDGGGIKDFDPISEIEELERKLHDTDSAGEDGGGAAGADGDGAGSGDNPEDPDDTSGTGNGAGR